MRLFQASFLCFFWTSGAIAVREVLRSHPSAAVLVFGVAWLGLVTFFVVRSIGSLLRRHDISVELDRVIVASRLLGMTRSRALRIDAIRGVRWIEVRGRGRMLVFDVAGSRVVVERPLTYPEANHLEAQLRAVLDARQRALAEAASEATLSGDTPYRALTGRT